MIPEFQELLVKAVGLAIAIHVVVWGVFQLLFRRLNRPPVVGLNLFALSLGVWNAGCLYFGRETWVGHLGAALIFTTALFLWVLFDCLICCAWLADRRKIHLPIIL